jgi:hypothetical protein
MIASRMRMTASQMRMIASQMIEAWMTWADNRYSRHKVSAWESQTFPCTPTLAHRIKRATKLPTDRNASAG